MEELILQLKNIGFTEYEAKVFVSLVELGFASASDVHNECKKLRKSRKKSGRSDHRG